MMIETIRRFRGIHPHCWAGPERDSRGEAYTDYVLHYRDVHPELAEPPC